MHSEIAITHFLIALMKTFSMIVAAAILLPQIAFAFPADVTTDAWYGSAVSSFVSSGYLPESQPFRPTHNATRGEFVDLIVKMLGGATHAPYSTQSFDDVPMSSTLFNAFEEAGLTGWLKGTNSCYGTHPCSANPNGLINRAEAAAMIIRAFGLNLGGASPSFNDNAEGQWFTEPIRTAASLCVLKGDEGTGKVRPANNMIRAEMVVMLSRAQQHLQYPSCNTSTVVAPTSTPQVFPQRSSSTSSISSTLPIDPEAAKLKDFKAFVHDMYQTLQSTQTNMDQMAGLFSGTTGYQLVQLSSQFSDKISQLKVYDYKATLGTLQMSDMLAVAAITDSANDISRRALAIAKAARSIPTSSYQQYYYVPSVSTQPTESHQQMCDRMSAEAALSGGFGSSATAYQLYQAGCMTTQQFCNGFALGGTPQNLWPAECR